MMILQNMLSFFSEFNVGLFAVFGISVLFVWITPIPYSQGYTLGSDEENFEYVSRYTPYYKIIEGDFLNKIENKIMLKNVLDNCLKNVSYTAEQTTSSFLDSNPKLSDICIYIISSKDSTMNELIDGAGHHNITIGLQTRDDELRNQLASELQEKFNARNVFKFHHKIIFVELPITRIIELVENDDIRYIHDNEHEGGQIKDAFSLRVMLQEPQLIIDANGNHKFKPPLQQIRDGILPQDVKCNENKILFFNVRHNSSDVMPLCIYESTLEKLVSEDLVFFWWSFRNYYVDFDYVQDKMNNLEFNNQTNLLVTNLDDVKTNSTLPTITLLQEYKSSSDSSELFYNIFSLESGKLANFTSSLMSINDPRKISYYSVRDMSYGIQYFCSDQYLRILEGDLRINVTYSEDIILSSTPKLEMIQSNSTNQIYQFEFGSLYPTGFNSDDVVIKKVSESQCHTDDSRFSSVYPVYYYYVVKFEVR